MTTQMPLSKRPGRPRGYSPGKTRKITHELGIWSWNHDRLYSKIQQTASCWHWLGAKNDWNNLFGAYKNDHPQMVQANRIIYMDAYGEDITHWAVSPRCQNKSCCRPDHFELVPNKLNMP